jgi:hypothetical protein
LPDDDDLKDIINAEKGRLKPAARLANREKQKRLRQMEKLLERGTEEDMTNALVDAGIDPESPEGRHALKVWRENQY